MTQTPLCLPNMSDCYLFTNYCFSPTLLFPPTYESCQDTQPHNCFYFLKVPNLEQNDETSPRYQGESCNKPFLMLSCCNALHFHKELCLLCKRPRAQLSLTSDIPGILVIFLVLVDNIFKYFFWIEDSFKKLLSFIQSHNSWKRYAFISTFPLPANKPHKTTV